MLKALIRIIAKIHKRKCAHDWELSEYQVLTDDGTITVRCKLCGTYTQIDHDAFFRAARGGNRNE